MEKFILDRDIVVFCATASSFPEGAQAVHDKMDAMVPFAKGRNTFGLSRPNEQGVIVYKSAAEELFPGELEKWNLEKLVIRKGNYISILLPDFLNHLAEIGPIFQQLISHAGIDPQSWCVEWILRDQVLRCMVRMDD